MAERYPSLPPERASFPLNMVRGIIDIGPPANSRFEGAIVKCWGSHGAMEEISGGRQIDSTAKALCPDVACRDALGV
jgi:hypothetical protein